MSEHDGAGRPPEPGERDGSDPDVPTCYRHPMRESHIRCQRCDRPICPDCMRDAAVGFQCPDCVAQGAKETRQTLTPYGGQRPSQPALTSQILIGLNLLVWLAITLTGASRSWLYDKLALLPQGRCVPVDSPGSFFPNLTDQALCVAASSRAWTPGVADGAFWQLLTSMFTHVAMIHIGFNMLALWVLGPQLELLLGRARFLALYLLSGLAGSVAVYWLSNPHGSTVGASGAIFGLMGALLVVGYKLGGNVQQLLMWLGINVVITFVGGATISWQGHLGGLVGGLLLAALIVFAPKAKRTQVQVAGMVAFGLLLLALTVARTLMLN